MGVGVWVWVWVGVGVWVHRYAHVCVGGSPITACFKVCSDLLATVCTYDMRLTPLNHPQTCVCFPVASGIPIQPSERQRLPSQTDKDSVTSVSACVGMGVVPLYGKYTFSLSCFHFSFVFLLHNPILAI